MRTSRAQANRLRAVQLRMFLANERVMALREAPLLNRMIKDAARAFERGRKIETAINKLESLQRRVFAAMYRPVQKEFAALARAQLGLKSLVPVEQSKQTIVFEEELLAYIETQSLAAATSVTATSIALVRDAIFAGEEAGLSVSAITSDIRGLTGMSRFRAARIARTETHSAAMDASQTFARSTELELLKIWLTTTDGNERDTHAGADLQEQELEESYIVGGAALRFPGDPGGPPEEIINCRCGELYEETDE